MHRRLLHRIVLVLAVAAAGLSPSGTASAAYRSYPTGGAATYTEHCRLALSPEYANVRVCQPHAAVDITTGRLKAGTRDAGFMWHRGAAYAAGSYVVAEAWVQDTVTVRSGERVRATVDVAHVLNASAGGVVPDTWDYSGVYLSLDVGGVEALRWLGAGSTGLVELTTPLLPASAKPRTVRVSLQMRTRGRPVEPALLEGDVHVRNISTVR